MKSIKYAIIAIAVLVALVLVGGCGGGGKTHTVTSPWYGDLYGVATEPSNEETGIATSRADSWIHVFWPNGNYPPPASFTVTVQKEEHPNDWGAIHTTLSNSDSDPEGGSWWFQPDNDFSPGTWYRIVIAVPGVRNSAIAYFKTAGTRDAAVSALTAKAEPGTAYRPSGAANATGQSDTTHNIESKR